MARAKEGPVPKEALAFFKAKGLKPAFSYLDVWQEEHNIAFTVAKVMEADILADIQASILDAVEKGVPFDQWKREIKNTMDRSGWTKYGADRTERHRLSIIYHTNVRSARAVGQWQRIERTKRRLPYLLYGLGPSQRHRPVHEGWAGLILPADDPFWDTAYPPNGYGCKCHVTQISESRAGNMGGPSNAPNDATEGVQDGFRYHAGKTANREKVLAKTLSESKQQLSAVTKKAAKASKG